MLTDAELDFLKSQGLSAKDVYDGRRQSAAHRQAGAKAEGLTVILGTPCGRGGHRLRSRSGHCVQCDTSKLSYQHRHRSRGYVYIAGSLSAKLLKIGTTRDVAQRDITLQYDNGYGEITDWKMLFRAKVENAGEVEGNALRSLQGFKIPRAYEKEGSKQVASEILNVSFGRALKAVEGAIGDSKLDDLWMSPEWADYDRSE